MYGCVVFDQKKEIPEAMGHSLDMKDSGKTLTIKGYHWYNLPKFAQAALANEPNVNALPNTHIAWMNPNCNYSHALFRIPVLMTMKDILKQEITVYYSCNSYLPVAISF